MDTGFKKLIMWNTVNSLKNSIEYHYVNYKGTMYNVEVDYSKTELTYQIRLGLESIYDVFDDWAFISELKKFVSKELKFQDYINQIKKN